MLPEKEILAKLIDNDREDNSGLRSYIHNMLAIVEFDAYRKGKLVSQQKLNWYSQCVAKSVTDGLQYFIGNGHPYPDVRGRYAAAIAAHITHLLRDTRKDTTDGFINIPQEYLEAYDISPGDIDSPPYRSWVRARVEQARKLFKEGKRYLDQLDVLRCKIVGHWYCARFELVLETIEQDEYYLRPEYKERQNLSAWLRIIRLAITISLRHYLSRQWHKRQKFTRDSEPSR